MDKKAIKGAAAPQTTCGEYRAEMILAALQRRLAAGGLSEKERQEIEAEVLKLENELGM